MYPLGWVGGAYAPGQFLHFHVRHVEVGDNELDIVMLFERCERFAAAGGVMDLVVLQAEDFGQREARAFAVVDNQDRGDGGIGDSLDGADDMVDGVLRILDEVVDDMRRAGPLDRKSTRLNSSH